MTLIELVAVIAVVAILAVSAAPTFQKMGAIRQSSGTARVASDIRYARAMAAATRLRTWVAFNVGGQQYSLFIEDPANLGKANRLAMVNPLTRASFVITMNTGELADVALVSVNFDTKTEVEFDNYGKPYDGDGNALAADGNVTLSGGRQVIVTETAGLVKAQ